MKSGYVVPKRKGERRSGFQREAKPGLEVSPPILFLSSPVLLTLFPTICSHNTFWVGMGPFLLVIRVATFTCSDKDQLTEGQRQPKKAAHLPISFFTCKFDFFPLLTCFKSYKCFSSSGQNWKSLKCITYPSRYTKLVDAHQVHFTLAPQLQAFVHTVPST